MALVGFQRKYLRGLAHGLSPAVQIGRPGLTDEVIQAVQAALQDHELVKVSMRKPEDKKAMATALAERTEAQLCGLIGHTIILYRPDPDSPGIRLPRRADKD